MIPTCLLPGLVHAGGKTEHISANHVKSLASGFHGRLLTPSDSDFFHYALAMNKRVAISPQVVAFCTTASDVCHVVQWARDHQFAIKIRSGGHSYEGLSTGPQLVIDLSLLNQIQVHPKELTMEAQSGAKLGSVYEALWHHHLAVAAGSCPTVGLGGLVLGGGMGYLGRKLGLTIDHLAALHMVNAAGEIVHAAPSHHADLFWACRGGGAGSFGVVTSFSFANLLPVESVSLFSITWSKSKTVDAFMAWQDWAPVTSMDLTSQWGLGARYETATCQGQFVGSPTALEALLKPLLDVEAVRSKIWEVSFMEAIKHFGGEAKEARRFYFKNKSHYAVDKLAREHASLFLQQVCADPKKQAWVLFDSYGGAIAAVSKNATAFAHRDVLYAAQYGVDWENAEDSAERLAWIRTLHKKVSRYFSDYAYCNYCDLDLENWGHAYYGDNYQKLIAIKTKYDPHNVFQHAQSIPVLKQPKRT